MAEAIGQKFEAQVRGFASDGRGVVSHPNGRTFFVPGVWMGERIVARITQLKGRMGFAECIELLEASPERVEPPCEHHGPAKGECGGCPWMIASYDAQLKAKQERIDSSFARIDCDDKVNPIWPAPSPLGYRTRAQLKTDGKQLGYVSAQSNTLAPISECQILTEKNAKTLAALQEQLPNKEWRAAKRHELTSIDIDENTDTSSVRVNQRLPFQQANAEQNKKMLQWLSEKLENLSGRKHVLELFCGSGNLTETISGFPFEKITAVEAVEEALEGLEKKSLNNVSALQANLFSEQGIEKAVFNAKTADVLVLDPPREGLKVKGNLCGKKSKIKDIFYISCDLATLVRDIAYFKENKFKVKEIQPLDMFPQTPHVETLVWLRK
ncbi:MAG: class I SAM-dependent RNA methyltransferase [Agarilytica sp.]